MDVLGRPGCRRAGRRTGVVYGLLAAATVADAVYGYRVPLAMSRVPASGRTALPALGVIAFAPGFTTAALPETGGYPLDGYGPTWLVAAVAAGLSGPIAFITLLGDYTRYLSPARHSSRRVLHATWLGLALGLLVPQLFGTFTAYASGAALDVLVGVLAVSLPSYEGPLLADRPGGTAASCCRGRWAGWCMRCRPRVSCRRSPEPTQQALRPVRLARGREAEVRGLRRCSGFLADRFGRWVCTGRGPGAEPPASPAPTPSAAYPSGCIQPCLSCAVPR
ncbi:cytosine permease [Streptomyces coeruleorubidus]|uniref:cytosine permease n=1 Tax=Streptomyces coeruleorubidus TaxID=116188 RepID=UPI0036F8104A